MDNVTVVTIAAALEDNRASYQMDSSIADCMAGNKRRPITYF